MEDALQSALREYMVALRPCKKRPYLSNNYALLSLLLPFAAGDATATCWQQAAERYGISTDLLYAVARVESDLRPHAVNRGHLARTGSYDIGLMQINSSHLRALQRYGISEGDLYEPCTNLHVGAWILAGIFARNGVSWDSVGAYNAACTQLKGDRCRRARARYAWKVYRQLPGRHHAMVAGASP